MEGDNAVATLGISFAENTEILMKQGDGLFVTETGEELSCGKRCSWC